MRTSLFGVLSIVVLATVGPATAQGVRHPLDPLSFRGSWTVLEVLQQAGRVNTETRFSIVHLRQPDKNVVWSWSQGRSLMRQGFAVVRQGADAYEAVVDVRTSAGSRRGPDSKASSRTGWMKSSGRWTRRSSPTRTSLPP